MREQTMRSGSYFDRRDSRPHQGSKPRQVNPRPKRSVNLGRLCDELGSDLLGAALGLSDDALRILIDGRDHVKSGQYAMHLSHRLQDLCIPPDWLDRPLAPIAPEYLRALRIQASGAPNKSPIRRANFRRIAQSFSGREGLLADALEMVEPSIINVAEGGLVLDEGRFSHINPRLMQAGFPDGWLEQPEPDLTDSMISRLEQMATDSYEQRLSENDEDESSTNAGQAFVSPQPPTADTTSSQPVATPVTSKESVMATLHAPTPTTNSSEPKEAPQPFKAGGAPSVAARPAAHPSAGKLPRNVLAAGRKIGGAPAALPSALAAAAPKAPTPKTTVTAPAAALPTPETAAGASPAVPAYRTGTAPSKEVSQARASALDQVLATSRRGAKVALWRDILGSSLAVWGNVRRGAILFRNDWADNAEIALGLPQGWLDNPSFPPASLAAWVTDLEAPVPTLQTAVPAPAVAPKAAPAAAPKPTPAKESPAPQQSLVAKPFTRKTPAAPRVTLTTAPTAAPQHPAAPAPAATTAALVEVSTEATPAASGVVLTAATPVVTGSGPLAQALIAIIQQRSAAGTFTETQALLLINDLMKN